MRIKVRRVISLYLALGLSSCGFTPMYKENLEHGQAMSPRDLLGHTKISMIPNREGQQLRNFLLDQLNPLGEPNNPLYRLDTNFTFTRLGVALRRDGTFQRYRITARANFTLVDCKTEKILYQDVSEKTSSFIVTDSNARSAYSATVSERSEQKNLAKNISEDIALSLLSFIQNHQNRQTDQLTPLLKNFKISTKTTRLVMKNEKGPKNEMEISD